MKKAALWIILLIQPLLYWQGLFGEFVFDDRFLILDTMGQMTLSNIWGTGLWQDGVEQANFYRPLFSTTIWLDQYFFQAEPLGYHIHSLCWHLLNICLFAHFSTRVLSGYRATVALSIFALHPLLSEVVFWIAARNDTMAMTFVLSFLCLLWKKPLVEDFGVTGQSGYSSVVQIGLLGSFICGLLSKESALIVYLPVCWYWYRGYPVQKIFFSMVLSTVGVFAWRHHIGIETPAMTMLGLQKVFHAAYPMGADGFGRLLFPWRLSPSTPLAWLTVTWWQSVMAAVTLATLFYISVCHQSFRIWIVWIMVGVGLSLPAIVYTGNIGDRYWSMSLIGWSIILGHVLTKRWFWIPLPFWMVTIFLRGAAWTTDLAFWSQEHQLNPTPYSAVSLALIHYNFDQFEPAMHLFYEGFSGEPPHLDGCAPFVSSVLSVEGPESALQASHWSIGRGCSEDGEMLGLQSVIHVDLKQWTDAQAILDRNIVDPRKRLNVVQMLLDWRKGETDAFCRAFNAWPDSRQLSRQLKILSPMDYEAMQQASCVLPLQHQVVP